jgi:hypothetical protein
MRRRWVASALGLAFAAAIAVAGFAGGRFACGVDPLSEEFLERELAMASAWEPPADAEDPDAWLPESVDGYRLTLRDLPPVQRAIDLELEGLAEARYEGDGRLVEVRVLPMSRPAYSDLRRELGEVLDRKGVFLREGLATDEFKRFSYTHEGERGLLWWRQGWLLFFWTDAHVELHEFGLAYREAVAGAPSP